MDIKSVFIFITYLCICDGVPPTPVDRLWEELDKTKGVMTNIATQLDRFNSLYLMKLEQKVVTIAATLANIDSNIKNLQERAHVWDTFQLHVSAWNEQINTLDKKIEIISKGQEKILTLDTKVNTIANMDYKIERVTGKQDDMMSLIQSLIKIVENQPHDPLLNEFTTRGVLSTLKLIERKLDKVQMQFSNSQSLLAKQIIDKRKETDSKLLIKCNTPPKVEELLSDVASKVDVIFDKFTSNEESSGDFNHAEEQRDSTEVSQESKSDPDLKLIKGLLRRLNQPCKRTIKVLENLENSIKTIDNTTLTIQEDGQSIQNDVINYSENHDKHLKNLLIKSDDISHKIDQLKHELNQKFSYEHEIVSSHFQEQREHIAAILQNVVKNNLITITNDPIIKSQDKPKVLPEFIPESVFNSNKTNCHELSLDDPSGIYKFQNRNARYCEINENGIWTVIQRRGVNPNDQNFSLSWFEYKNGFGQMDKDFWFGNDHIHKLTTDDNHILRVELEDFDGNTAWAEYSEFRVLSEAEKYRLIIGRYRGNASDSFSTHNNSSFSTYDYNNDDAPPCCPCSPTYGGGWWFYSCFEANLNGVYQNQPTGNSYFKGLIWEHWLGNYSLRKTKMMIQPITDDNIFEETVPEIPTTIFYDTEEEEEIPEDP